MSSNSALVGEAWNAQFPWKWQRNTSISRSIFSLPPSPFIFRPLVPPLPHLPYLCAIECPPGLSPFRPSSPAAIISFVRSTSFHLLDYRRALFRPRKKQCSVTIFRWKQNSVSMCFLSTIVHAQLGKSAILRRYLCIGRSKEKFDLVAKCLFSVNLYIECN